MLTRFALLLLVATAGRLDLVAADALVLQSDFGQRDGAVAAMKGVAVGVDPRLPIFDLTHEIPSFDIWEAAYRLKQTAPYWPAGTVFVSVVDPGVGTERRSIVLQTKSGHFFVSPDNGTLTLVADELGIVAVRAIDGSKNRRPDSEQSHTFHGRDVYAFTGARLAAAAIAFAEVGPELEGDIVRLPYERARRDTDTLIGNIPALDLQYGNVWTNIPASLFAEFQPRLGETFHVVIVHGDEAVFAGEVPYARAFGDVEAGAPLLYVNSLLNLAVALNLDSFAARHRISAGADWTVRISHAD